ncbi:hypothetical protein ACWDA7_44210, partial [Streptomyces sp. NPDC001156]
LHSTAPDRIVQPGQRFDAEIPSTRPHTCRESLKDHQILRQCRRRGNAINHAVAGVAAHHNLKLR